jgi:branched-chain amino acid transport system substrate-binding protein
MKKIHTIPLLVTAFVVILLVAFSLLKKDTNFSDKNPVVIGGAFGLTGDAAAWGLESQRGVQIAIDEVNSSGGVGGRKLVLNIQDTRSNARDTISAVQKQ